jgi:hypothetical protein
VTSSSISRERQRFGHSRRQLRLPKWTGSFEQIGTNITFDTDGPHEVDPRQERVCGFPGRQSVDERRLQGEK